jgi:hypothetical protein
MKVIPSTKIVYFDVDDTLVMWEWRQFDPEGKSLIQITDPISGFTEYVMPHSRHIELLKRFKVRGHTIVVWSQGGYAWAEAVVKALDLESAVDLCMTKPDWYVDDLPSSAFMRSPVYLHPTDPTKDKRSWDVEDEE